MPTVSTAPAASQPFTLNPGVVFDSKVQKECVVRLLTRRDFVAIAKLGTDEERADALLARSIQKLGTITDQSLIAEMVEFLTRPDFDRINEQIAALETQYSEAPATSLAALRKRIPSTELVSDPFPLNPGITINKKHLASCIVRLMTRGEWKKIEAESDPLVRDDMSLGLSIVQLGDETLITEEHLNALTLPDTARINTALEDLRVRFAPETKSHECPSCGHRFKELD